MISSFESYLSGKYVLTLEEMMEIHTMMLVELTDDDAKELYKDLLVCATKYAGFRSHWELWSRQERMDKDESRSKCHDVLIDHFNILARYTKQIGHEARWRELLGDINKDSQYRKRIGDFACFLVFINSINAR